MIDFKTYSNLRDGSGNLKHLPKEAFQLGRILRIGKDDDTYRVLVVHVEEGKVPLCLVLTGENTGRVIHANALRSSDITVLEPDMSPRTDFFYQTAAQSKETSSSTEPTAKNMNKHRIPSRMMQEEALLEVVSESAVRRWEKKIKQLEKQEATQEKLNLLLEMLLSEIDGKNIKIIH